MNSTKFAHAVPAPKGHAAYPQSLGALEIGPATWSFRVWAPRAKHVELHLFGDHEQYIPMRPADRGYFELVVDNIPRHTLYKYRLDRDREYPDPASRSQPQGVHGPSQTLSTDFAWSDDRWTGLPLSKYIIYELHIGTFSPEGTFDAAIAHLDDLKDLGVTAVEIMPIAEFPGSRNWGYDGVFPFAPQSAYGGPAGFHRFVDACHEYQLAVVLDVVYNHLGPEGNYFAQFGDYFTDRYRTPWGQAFNFDGPHSDEVRRYFIENALYWTRDFHVDALRLDAVHAIFDNSAVPFLQELAQHVHQQSDTTDRRVHIIAESHLNDPRHVLPAELGGYGLDSQWNDDMHHAIHTLLTGEQDGYYEDFSGFHDLVIAYRDGFAYAGRYSKHRGHRYGTSSRALPRDRFIVFSQNHDQIGNRLFGERLSSLVSFEDAKLAAGLVLLSPYIPLLFMGEEYGETAPFQYFISHTDADLVAAVRRGRRDEFADFKWNEDAPDPQDRATFNRSKLNRELKEAEPHATLWRFYQKLIDLRRNLPALACLDTDTIEVEQQGNEETLLVRRRSDDDDEAFVIFHCGTAPATLPIPLKDGEWDKLLDSAETQWRGPGSTLPQSLDAGDKRPLSFAPRSFSVFAKKD